VRGGNNLNLGKNGNVLASSACIDFEPPQVSLRSPIADALLSERVSLEALASDNKGISHIAFQISGELGSPGENTFQTIPNCSSVSTVSESTPDGDVYRCEWDTAQYANGKYTLIAQAFDDIGNPGISLGVDVMVENEVGVVSGTWVRRAMSGSSPAKRRDIGMVYDGNTSRIVLFGGKGVYDRNLDREIMYNDLWEWDSNKKEWIDRTPADVDTLVDQGQWPNPLAGVGMTFDSSRNRVLVYGGYEKVSYTGYRSHQKLWEWDGSTGTWTNLTPDPLPQLWPRGGQGIPLMYDPTIDRTVALTSPGVTWFLDAKTMTWSVESYDKTGLFPFPTRGALNAMVYDPNRERGYVLIGYSDLDLEYISNPFSMVPLPAKSGRPYRRFTRKATFDRRLDRLITFGGVSHCAAHADLLAYDRDQETWTFLSPQTPNGRPRGRDGHGMAYDPNLKYTLIFGGEGLDSDCYGSPELNDTWELSFEKYTPPVTIPPVKAPTNLHVTLENEFSISIQWNDRSDNEDTFVIERRNMTNNSAWKRAGEVGKNVTTFMDGNPPLVPSTTYQYRVKAVNSEAESAYSNVTTGFTCSDPRNCLE